LQDGMEVGPHGGMDVRVAALIATMEADVAKPLRLTNAADYLNLSVSRLVHLFTLETGLPPGRYLRELRLRHASMLLRETRLTVKQVMAKVGYNDASHFSRDFKRRYGLSPQALRRALG
jgi:AraC family transcriptional regulator, arabinose operon regulatory protein